MKSCRIGLAAMLVAGALGLFGGANPASAAPGDANGVSLDVRAGPAVWIEELWEVKPDKLDEFLKAYDDEYYALARRTPGYRGYTVMTSVPAPRSSHPNQASADTETTRLGTNDIQNRMIGRHPSIRLEGRTVTEQQINWDFLYRNAYNVRIVHHVQTWADADQLRARMDKIYASEHPGDNLADHLAKTVFTFANNYWSTPYRMIATGWPQTPPPPGPRKPTDADGLNLEPRKGPGVIIYEHWDIKPEKMQVFLDIYDKEVYAWIRKGDGYRGYSIVTSLPPQPWEKSAAPMKASDIAQLGGSSKLYVPSPGVMMIGEIRTDTSINVGAMYNKTFNLIVVHEVKDWESRWYYETNARFAAAKNGADFHKSWRDTLMPLSNNHWDNGYRVVKESFTPDAPSQSGAR